MKQAVDCGKRRKGLVKKTVEYCRILPLSQSTCVVLGKSLKPDLSQLVTDGGFLVPCLPETLIKITPLPD